MAIGPVVTRGFSVASGQTSTIKLMVTAGYLIASAVVTVTTTYLLHGARPNVFGCAQSSFGPSEEV